MSKLFPFLPFDTCETPLSFAARLAAFHIGSRTGPFLRDIGVNLQDLARGQGAAIQRLADRSGVDPDSIGLNAAQGLDRRHYNLRGEHVSAEFLASPYTVFCPACLLADDQASGCRAQVRRHRWIWQLRVVRTCPEHGLPLIRRKAEFSGDRFHELAVVVDETGDRLEDLTALNAPRPVSALQAYAVGRLEGRAGPAWLDCEGLEQAVRSSEMLGVLMVHGAKPNLDKFTEDDWDHAGAVGFSYTSQGETGIRRALADVQANVDYNGSSAGPQHVFGRLYQWLARSRAKKHPGDIKRILREHIFETMEVASGGVVLGEALAARRLHTCATLARETGLDPRTLRGVLAAKRLLPECAAFGSHHVFNAKHGEEIARSMRRLASVISLPKRLGCTRPLADQLLTERVLTPIVTDISHAPDRTKKSVDCEEIADLIHRLRSKSKLVADLPAGMVHLATAAMKSRAPAVEIVHLILGGYLTNVVWLERAVGFAAIHVDPAEAKALVAKNMIGLSPAEAFASIRVPVASGWELVDRCLLPSIKVISASGAHVFHRFRREDVDAFTAEFTTEAVIGNALEIELRDLKFEMKAAGATPFLLKNEIGIRIFRRSELPLKFRV